MAAKQCPDQYYDRMASAKDDKLKILQYLSDGDCVLDVGAGGGALAELLLEQFPHMQVTALDQSDSAAEKLHALAARFPDRLTVVQADFFEFKTDARFDAVVFCSSLHEIFSYTEYKGERFRKETVTLALDHAISFLKQGAGKIIIRDGVASRHNPKVLLKYTDPALKRLAERFENEFEGFPLKIVHTPLGDIMPYNSMMELLYTITWGEESFPREVQEWYGYHTLEDWEREGKRLIHTHGMLLIHAEKYLQPGYGEHLKDKVVLESAPRLRWDGRAHSRPIEFPASNCLVVFAHG